MLVTSVARLTPGLNTLWRRHLSRGRRALGAEIGPRPLQQRRRPWDRRRAGQDLAVAR